MDNTGLKKITEDDLLQLQEIGKRTFAETFASLNSEENMDAYLSNSFSIEKLKDELRDENSEFYFAESENRVIGYLKINTGTSQTENKNENSLEIERIYVLREFHGKKVGQLLYDKAMEIARLNKVAYVWLGVWEDNNRALSFYKKNGFTAFDKHSFKLGDDLQTDIMMKLELPS